jgi:hypothetical protein
MSADNSGVTATYTVKLGKPGDLGPAGGTVVYDAGSYVSDSGGKSYRFLEAAPNNTTSGQLYSGLPSPPVYNPSFSTIWKWAPGYDIIGTSANGIGFGRNNTNLIVAKYGTSSTYAASLCTKYTTTVGSTTYSDWFLPSAAEFSLLYSSAKTSSSSSLPLYELGYPATLTYWTSTEYSPNPQYFATLNGSTTSYDSKQPSTNTYYVWPMREF